MNFERKNKLKWNLLIASTTGAMTVIVGIIVSMSTGFKADEHNLIVPVAVWIGQLLVSYFLLSLIFRKFFKNGKRRLFNFGTILLSYNFSVIFVLIVVMFEKKVIDVSYIDMFLLIMQVADFTYLVLKFSLMDKKELVEAFDEKKSDEEIIDNISANVANDLKQVIANKKEVPNKKSKKKRGKRK